MVIRVIFSFVRIVYLGIVRVIKFVSAGWLA